MFDSKLITEGVMKPHYKEPSDLWVLRVLELSLEESGHWMLGSLDGLDDEMATAQLLPAEGNDQNERTVTIPATRGIALKSWATPYNKGRLSNGVLILVTGPQGVLGQRKDGKHPVKAYCHKLSFFGGDGGKGEPPRDAALRELYEEVRDLKTADQIASLMKPHSSGQLTLDAADPEHEGVEYQTTPFVACAGDEETFKAWHWSILGDPGTGESDPAYISWDELRRMVVEQDKEPGLHLIASLHEVARLLLQ